MNSYTSIYIPRMSVFHTDETVRNLMSHYRIGTVSYIDFTPINKKPGFFEDVDGIVKSAFVHFFDPCLCSDNQYHYRSRITFGNDDFWHSIQEEIPYKLQINEGEYWICLKNKNPVKRTLMNIHQVVENGRHLENLIEQQNEKIREQQATIQNLTSEVEGIKNIIYQLVGGLFNEKTQGKIIDNHLSMISMQVHKPYEEGDSNDLQDESKWSIWPTTRQGDDCEKRIEELERIVEQLKNEDQDSALYAKKYAKFEDDSTICSNYIEEQIERDRLLSEEERYHERLREAIVDKAASYNDW